MNNPTQLLPTDSIAVEVSKDAKICPCDTLCGYCKEIFGVSGDFEKLGEVTVDSISNQLDHFLKYEWSWTEQDFRDLLQSNGIFFVNPIEKPNVNDDYWRDANGFTDEYMDEMSRWQEAERKLVEKVVILKPL